MLAEIQGVVVDFVQVPEQVIEPQTRIGHEVVEALHQLRLRENGEFRQLHRPVGRQALAPEPRVRGRVADQVFEALLLEALQALARPALTRDQLLACSDPARHVLQALDPVTHRVLLGP